MNKTISIIFVLILISLKSQALSTNEELELLDLNSEELNSTVYSLRDKSSLNKHNIEVSYAFPTSPLRVSRLSGFHLRYSTYGDKFGYSFYAANSSIAISEATSLTGNFDADEELLSVLELGVGLNMKSILVRDFFKSSKYSDEISALILYSSASTDVLENDFSGYGLLSSYAITRSLGDFWNLVARMNYHLHSLEDSATEQPLEVTASWLSLSIGLSANF